jgi:hypothetical protein
VKPIETLREEAFALTYCMNGITYADVENMASSERVWFLRRLRDQLRDEAKKSKSK